jgi:hypothetical protein
MSKQRPTIAELEEILAKPDGSVAVEIRPDGSVTAHDVRTIPWPDPTPEMLKSEDFNAVCECIKGWDINVPGAYRGYCGATGNHARAILDALAGARAASLVAAATLNAGDGGIVPE